MLVAPDLESVLRLLNDDLNSDRHVKLVGIVFAPPKDATARLILDRIDDYHYRFGADVHFFFAGWSRYAGERRDGRTYPAPDGDEPPWVFSPAEYAGFIAELEQVSRFQPSGEAEVVLVVAMHDSETDGTAALDLSQAIVLNVAAMLRDNVIGGVGQLLEQVARVGKDASRIPVIKYSDRQGLKVAGSEMTAFVLDKLPLGLGAAARKARHYAVRNLAL